MSREDDDAVHEIAYAEAVRALSEQFALVEGIRSRAGLLLSAGAVATSFLGAQALGRAGLGALAWLALAGFCAASALCLAVPSHRSLAFSVGPIDLLSLPLAEGQAATHHRPRAVLALQLQSGFAENQRWVERLELLLQLASALFAADVVVWLYVVALS